MIDSHMITLGCYWIHPNPRDSIRDHLVPAISCASQVMPNQRRFWPWYWRAQCRTGTPDMANSREAGQPHSTATRIARVIRGRHRPSHVIAGSAVTAPDTMDDQRTRQWPRAPTRSAGVFTGRDDQVALARDFVRHALGPVPVVDEAVLLVSELCTNALH